jgi:hypothetical protein
MLRRAQYIVLMAAAGFLLLSTAIDVTLFTSNNSFQRSVSSGNQVIQGALQTQNLYHELGKALIDLSLSKNDPQLRELLARHGMNVDERPSTPAAVPASPQQGR